MDFSRDGIPVIDLEQFSSPQDYQKLREICKQWGCFRIVNHGVPLTLMSDMMKVARSVISMPFEIKQLTKQVEGREGYYSFGNPNTYHEAFRIYDVGSHSQAVHDFCSTLHASPVQRKIMEKYCEAILQMVMKIQRKVAESLEMEGNSKEGWPLLLKISGYYMTPDITTAKVVGPLATHSDPSFLTILQDDETYNGGFETMDTSGSLVPTSPSTETFLVLLGDIAHAWSNGRYLNAKHRVRLNEGMTSRISLTAFLYPPLEETIDAPSKLVDSEYPRLYLPFIFKDFYRTVFFKRMTGAQVLDQFLRFQPQ